MKLHIKFTLILIIATSNLFAQKDYRAILEIRGATEEFCISKDSTFWIATKTGDTYFSEGFDKPWKYGTFKTNEYDLVSGRTFERASFFNRDTGYISGFIQKDGKQDFIYWTNDGGKNWQEVKFGKSSWIDANYIDYKGNAWMSGNSQLVYYSNDFGKTWTSFDKIESTGNMRINTIFFENTKRGIVGDFWNRIYLTEDNCKTWTKITSPLDQKKYVRTDKNIRPTIYKAQIFGNNIIINQQNRIFWSKLDSIQWNELSDIIDYSYDKSSNKLFAISKDLKVHLFDSNFVSNWTSESNLVNAPISIKTLNGTLYAWHRAELTKVNENEFLYTPMYTLENPIATPYVTAKATRRTWGVNGREILQSDDLGKTWYRIDLLDFNIGNFKAINDYEAIISDSYYQKYYKYKITDDSTELIKYFIENPLSEFLSNPLKEVSFEIGSQGCFHSNLKVIEYKLENDSTFSASKIEQQGYKTEKEKFRNSFSAKVAFGILDAIDSNPFSKINVNELNISENDKDEYLKKIDLIEKDFKKGNTFDYEHGTSRYSLPYNKLDFEFYKNAVNQIDSFNNTILNNILGTRYGNWSTTTNWIKITFKNKKGEEISISNFDDMPNAWYLPWIVEANGLIFPINNIEVTKFIESNTPDDFISLENKNKLAIFQMIDYLYKKKINE
ncbi:MAG: hypothetical protein JXR82_07645 [Marinifilaceae bacterium]|nr:hypothetical protein [Marinifilaceae bacterium]